MKKLDSFVPYSRQNIDEVDKKSILEVLDSNLLTQGPKTIEFEEKIAEFSNASYALSFNSATSGLYCVFNALKKLYCKNNKKYKIITTPISFVATTNMMIANGFVPVFGDIADDGNLDLDSLNGLVDADTVAICSVDYAGKSVDVSKFRDFAKRHNLIWISDSSHAIGAKVLVDGNFKNIGSFADATIFSFHALKPLTTGEGGAVVTNNIDLFECCSLTRSHGILKGEFYNSDCLALGFNFRMNEISAALGISQLKRLDNFIDKRNKNSTLYEELFKNNPYFTVQNVEEDRISTRHLFPIILDSKFLDVKEKIVKDLLEFNVGTQVHYKPIYNFSFYKQFLSNLGGETAIKAKAEDFYRAELSIPNHQNLDLETIKKISEIIFYVFDKYLK